MDPMLRRPNASEDVRGIDINAGVFLFVISTDFIN